MQVANGEKRLKHECGQVFANKQRVVSTHGLIPVLHALLSLTPAHTHATTGGNVPTFVVRELKGGEFQ